MKVLVIDDHPLYLDNLIQAISRSHKNITVITSICAEEAIRILRSDTSFELILTEINLPGINGIEFIKTLSKLNIKIPVTIISAINDMTVVLQATEAGAVGYIPKPFCAKELIEAIITTLQGEKYLPASIHSLMNHSHNTGIHSSNIRLKITPKQFSVLELLATGLSNKNIALKLNLSEHTVKSHLKALYATLGVNSRISCVKKAEHLGLIDRLNLDSMNA